MSREHPTEHEQAITLYQEPDPDYTARTGGLRNLYWASCSQHGVIIDKTPDPAMRHYAVAFHLEGRL